MTEDELTEMENAIAKLYGQRELYLITRRQRKGAKRALKEVQLEQLRDGEDYYMKATKLIRQDSSESLIEIIQSEKYHQSLLGGGVLNSPSVGGGPGADIVSTSGVAKVINSYEFKMLADDPSNPIFCNSPNTSQIVDYQGLMRKTGSLVNSNS